MSDRRDQARQAAPRDSGFTLTEMLIVMSLLGIIMATLATVFTVIVRTTPDAQDRVNDARSIQGLVTWLPQDIDATPPDGFSRDLWPCAGAAPSPNSNNLITMSWNETVATVTNYAASYRYELMSGEWTVVRYTCTNGGTARRQNLTSPLAPWGAPAPGSVELCSSPIDTITNTCPTVIPQSVMNPPVVRAMRIKITHPGGDVSTIDAAPKNPDEDLRDDPDAVTNFPPTVTTTNHSLSLNPGASVVLDLQTTFGVNDFEGDVVTGAIDSFAPAPAGVTASTAHPLQATINASSSAPAGPVANPLVLIISDSIGGYVKVNVNITINPVPNQPPQVPTPVYALRIKASTTAIVPLDITNGVYDPEGQNMTLTVLSWPPAILTGSPAVGGSLDPLDVRVSAGPSIGTGTVPIIVRITDSAGGWADAQITVQVVAASPNSAPSLTNANPSIMIMPGNAATLNAITDFGASDTNGDPFSISIDPTSPALPAHVTTKIQGNNLTVTVGLAAAPGPLPAPIKLLVTDMYGASTPATLTVTIGSPAPPPTSCVLGTLTATPNNPSRIGSSLAGAHLLTADMVVTLNYTGVCEGLRLRYDTGHATGLGLGTGRVFPIGGSPTSIVVVGEPNGGSEKWKPGSRVLTASTTSPIAINTRSVTITVS